jgi:hypothetical protein
VQLIFSVATKMPVRIWIRPGSALIGIPFPDLLMKLRIWIL